MEHMNQSSSLEIEVDEKTVQKLAEMSDNDSTDIDVTVVKGHASHPDIYVAPQFKNLEIEGMNHDVEIVSGVPTNRLVKPNSKITVKVTTRVEDNNSAIFQE